MRFKLWRSWIAALDLLAPVRCPICNHRLGSLPRCSRCRIPRRALVIRELRHDRHGPYLILAGAPFAGDWRRLVHAFKYHDDPGARRLLVAQTALALPDGLHWDGLVPVPAHRTRVRERGREPVRELARGLSRALALPIMPVLERCRYTEPLTGKRRFERRKIVLGAFRARPATGCLLLVDDVSTSGTTLAACRSALLAAGAIAVDMLVAGRTPRPVGLGSGPGGHSQGRAVRPSCPVTAVERDRTLVLASGRNPMAPTAESHSERDRGVHVSRNSHQRRRQ